jgi:hypothetical protein
VEVVKQWPGSHLSNTQPQIRGLAAHLVFDGVKGANPRQSFGRCGGSVDDMDLVELAACMRPASNFIDGAVSVQVMEPGVMWRAT